MCQATAVVLRSRLWKADQKKSASPLALPLRYSNSSYHWTRALRVPTLPMLACVMCPENMRKIVPHNTLGGV